MPNERLRAAVKAARLDRDSIAQALRVDVRTIERWEEGRLPHPRHRVALAALLRQHEGYLWPHVGRPSPSGAEELVGLYGHRADVDSSVWRELLLGAGDRIDLLGFALLFLPEQHADLIPVLVQKARGGCEIRVTVADPTCEAVRLRDEEEALGGAIAKRITTALHYFRELRDLERVAVRLHTAPMYNSIFRFDDEMLVTPHLHGKPGYSSPALHLRKSVSDGLFAGFQSHFESIWATSAPADAYLR